MALQRVLAVLLCLSTGCDPTVERDNAFDPRADVVPPEPGRLVLDDDADWTSTLDVALRVEASEPDLTLRLIDGVQLNQRGLWSAGA